MTRLTPALAGRWEKCRAMIDARRWGSLGAGLLQAILLGKLKPLPGRIRSLSRAMRASAGNEASFLGIGRTLQTIYTDTAALIRFIQETMQSVMGDTDESILGQVGLLAKRVETALTRHQQRVAGSLTRIRAVADHLAGLHQACDQLGRIAMNLRVVGLNIGVESTRTAEGREMFTIVSREILTLSETVDEIAARIRADATAAMTEQMSAFDTISTGLQMLTGLTAEASGVVRAAVADADRGIAAFVTAFATADGRFQEISSRVGEIVMGIQFHDNMRQRVEHITDALDAAGRTFGGDDAGASPPDGWPSKRAALGNACAVVALQKAQLADVVSEINRVFRESVTAFGEMGTDIQELAGIISAVSADPEHRKISSDPFSKLTDALTGLGGLLDQGDALGRRIEESISKASEISRRFSQHLKDVDAISFETKIKALNAIVKAGHLSEEGRTLEVLAQEMNRLSQMTNSFVAHVEEKLTKVGQFGEQVQGEEGDAPETAGPHELHDLSEILATGIEELRRTRGLMSQRAGEAAERTGTLRTMVSRTVSELDFLTALAQEMSGHLDALGGITRHLAAVSKKWKLGERAGMETLTSTYTMQRERKIHRSLFLEGAAPEKTDDGQTPPEPEEEISLWDDFGEPPEERPEERPEETPPKKENDTGDFGDNIELF